MRFLAFSIILAAFLHVASANPYSPAAFLEFPNLPDCARNCKDIKYTTDSCAPPNAPASNGATYIQCFCQSENLRSLYSVGELCPDCDHKAQLVIGKTYSSVCGLPQSSMASSATPAPTPVLAPTPSSSVALTTYRTSTSIAQPTQTSIYGAEDPQTEHALSQTWIQKNWKYLLVGTLVFVFMLAITLYVLLRFIRHRRRQRPQSDAERYAELERALQQHLEDRYGPRARGQIVPLKTIDPKSIRERLSRLPLGRMPRSSTAASEPVINRRQIPHDPSTNILTSLNRDSPAVMHGTRTPQRPASARTTASGIGQRSVSSPLVPVSRELFRNISYAQSLRYYAEEQAERDRDLETIRSFSSGNLQRTDGAYDRQ